MTQPAATLPSASLPIETLPSTAAPIVTIEDIVAEINHQQLTAEIIGVGEGHSYFDQMPTLLSVNGETVEVYQFANEAEARAAERQVSNILGATEWTTQPNFYRSGTAIIFYLGETSEIVNALFAAFGYELGVGEMEPITIDIFLIAVQDNGAEGDLVGCQDSIVPYATTTGKPRVAKYLISSALRSLFDMSIWQQRTIDQYLNQSLGTWDLYNPLSQSNWSGVKLTDEQGILTVNLLGELHFANECDIQRGKAQIEYTVMQFVEQQTVEIQLNGEPIDEVLSAYTPTESISIETIAGQIRIQGVIVAVGDAETRSGLFDLLPSVLSVNGERVEVYQFIFLDAAQDAIKHIPYIAMSSQSSSERLHFFRSDKVIVFYEGSTPEIITALTAAYGADLLPLLLNDQQ